MATLSAVQHVVSHLTRNHPHLLPQQSIDLALSARSLVYSEDEMIGIIEPLLAKLPVAQAINTLVSERARRLHLSPITRKPVIAFVENNTYTSLISLYAHILKSSHLFDVLYVLTTPPAWTLQPSNNFESHEFVYLPSNHHFSLIPKPNLVISTEYIPEAWFDCLDPHTILSQVSHYLETENPLRSLLMRISRGLRCTHFWSTASVAEIPDDYFRGIFPRSAAPARPDAITVIEAGYPKLDKLVPRRPLENRIVLHLGKSASFQLTDLEEVLLLLTKKFPDINIHIRPFLHEASAHGILQALERYSHLERVRIDSGNEYDTDAYAHALAMVCLGESSSSTLFTLATGRPTFTYQRSAGGRLSASSPSCPAGTEIPSLDELERVLRRAVNLDGDLPPSLHAQAGRIVQAGSSSSYFVSSVQALANGSRLDDWRVFPLVCKPDDSTLTEADSACLRLRTVLNDLDYRSMLLVYQRVMPCLLDKSELYPWLPVDFATGYMAHAAYYASSLDTAHTLPVARGCLLEALSHIVEAIYLINNRCDTKIDVDKEITRIFRPR